MSNVYSDFDNLVSKLAGYNPNRGSKPKNRNHDLTAEELNLEYESAEGCLDAKRKAVK